MNNRFCWWSYHGDVRTSVPTIKAPHWLLRRAPRQQQQQVTGEDSNYHFPLRFCLSHSCAPARRSTTTTTTWTDLGGAQVRRWMLLEVGLKKTCRPAVAFRINLPHCIILWILLLGSSASTYTRRTVQSTRNNMFRVCRTEYALLWALLDRCWWQSYSILLPGHFLCATINLDTHTVHRGSSDAELCGSLPVCQIPPPPKCIGGLFVCLSRSLRGGGLLVHCCLMMIKMINTTWLESNSVILRISACFVKEVVGDVELSQPGKLCVRAVGRYLWFIADEHDPSIYIYMKMFIAHLDDK